MTRGQRLCRGAGVLHPTRRGAPHPTGCALVLAAIALALGLCAARVVAHERGELEERAGPFRLADLRRTDPDRTAQTVRAAEVRLQAGERYLVELCGEGASPSWAGALEVVLWQPSSEALVFRTPLDAPRLRQGRTRGARTCWTVGVGDVARTAVHAVELFWPGATPTPELDRAPLEVHVSSYRLPGVIDRLALGALGLGILLLLVGLGTLPPPSSEAQVQGGLGALGAALLALGALQLGTRLLPGGAAGMLLAGLLLGLGQLAIVRLTQGGAWAGRLALHRSTRPLPWAAPAVALAAMAAPLVLQRLFPPTGVAPVEVAIAWPSGKLAFATVGLVAPLAEELFFRGLVYGTLRARFGGRAALLGASLLFVGAHVPQALGDWASLGAIALTGLLLTGLRHATGALWGCMVAHVLYNAALIAIAWS